MEILFVDDEPHVLSALRRSLRGRTPDWALRFLNSAGQALASLDRLPADVVVSDMKMPEMDGTAFLREVRRRWPETARIVLSGHAELELGARSLGTCHRFLTKPCDGETLIEAIRGAAAGRSLLTEPRLRSLLGALPSLPSRPDVFRRVSEELESRSGSLERAGSILSGDAGMSAKVLQVANSAYFGIGRTVTDISRAVVLLGVEVVQALILAVHLEDSLPRDACDVRVLDGLWAHARRAAGFARTACRVCRMDAELVGRVVVSALLHEAGALVLAAHRPADYRAARADARHRRIPVREAERERFGATSAEVGGYLFALWGLPIDVVTAVAWHDRPSAAPVEVGPVLAMTHAACRLDGHLAPDRPPDDLDLDALDRVGFRPPWPDWVRAHRDACAEEIHR